MQNPTIILIDDDLDDIEIITMAIKSFDNDLEIIGFTLPDKFLDFVKNTDRNNFLTICDINMPKLNGFELRKIILDNEVLRRKCTPFIFYSTHADGFTVREA